jgi:hypothetical protein
MTGIETNRSSTESGTVTKPVFLIGNGSESGLNQNSDGKAGFIGNLVHWFLTLILNI